MNARDERVAYAWKAARQAFAFPWMREPQSRSAAEIWPSWLIANQVFYDPKAMEELARKSGTQVEDVLYEEFLHQLGRVALCPARLWLRLLQVIYEETADFRHAMFYLTAYLDFWVSTELARRGHTLRANILDAVLSETKDVLDPSLGEILAKALALRLGKAPKTRFPPFVEEVIARISNLSYSYCSATEQEGEVRAFTQALRTLFDASEPESRVKKEGAAIESRLVGSVSIPPDLGEALESLTQFTEKELEELGGILLKVAGEDGKIVAALSPWRKYVAMAEGEDLKLPDVASRSWGKAFPLEKRVWGVGDPFADLEPFSTVGTRIVPGMTQRRHRRSNETGYPAALIVIDESGSMPNPFVFSPAILGAICLARAFFRAGSQVAALNTSNHEIFCHFTTGGSATAVYKTLAACQRGSLDRLEAKTLGHLLDHHSGEVIAFVFTDSSFWDTCVPGLRYLQRHAHQTHVFIFGDKIPKHVADLTNERFCAHLFNDWSTLRTTIKRVLAKGVDHG